METRDAKMIVNKSGSGSNTFRVTLPATWIREMGLGEYDRDIEITYDPEAKEIVIRKKLINIS